MDETRASQYDQLFTRIMDEIIRDRHLTPQDLQKKYADHENILQNESNEEESIQKAFKLMKQEEKMRKSLCRIG